MLTLNVGFNKKQQGEEPYSSIGASCNLSVEASDELVKNPEGLQAEMSRLFEEVKAAVDQQIANGNGNGKPAANGNGGRVVAEEEPPADQERIVRRDSNDPIITPKQRQFLVALVQKRFPGGIKAFEAKLRQDGVSSVSLLTRRQASTIIDDLAGKNGNGKGGGR